MRKMKKNMHYDRHTRAIYKHRENVLIEKLIDYHGGPKAVFEKLRLKGSRQRVTNWRNRGRIELSSLKAAVKLFKMSPEVLNYKYADISLKEINFEKEVSESQFLTSKDKENILKLKSLKNSL